MHDRLIAPFKFFFLLPRAARKRDAGSHGLHGEHARLLIQQQTTEIQTLTNGLAVVTKNAFVLPG